MLRKVFFNIVMMIALLLPVIYTGNVSAAVAPVPGCSDSSGYTLVDLSSAVRQPSEYTDITIIAAATKWVDRAGNETDTGVWYFKLNDTLGRWKIKKNTDPEYINYDIPGAYYIGSDLIGAAGENSGKKTDSWPEHYLNGDLNYPYITTGSGGDIYLDISSVKVTEYNPPIIRMAGTIVFLSRGMFNSGSIYRNSVNFKYNIDSHKAWSEENGRNDELPMIEKSFADRRDRMIASAVFRCLYGRPFYQWYK